MDLSFIDSLLFGWLHWRKGLGSAMVAYVVTHPVSYAAIGLARSMDTA